MKRTYIALLAIAIFIASNFADPLKGALLVATDSSEPAALALESDIVAVQIAKDSVTQAETLEITLSTASGNRVYDYAGKNIGKELAIFIDGKSISRARIQEPFRQFIISGLSPAIMDAFALRFSERLSSQDSVVALQLAPGSALLFKLNGEKPWDYSATLADGSSMKLHLEDGEAGAAKSLADALNSGKMPPGRIVETKSGKFLIYRLPLPGRSLPTTLCAVRGLVGTTIVGLQVEVSDGSDTEQKAKAVDALLDAVLSRLSL